MSQVIDFFLNLDTHLSNVIATYGSWTYLILFLVIFAETGLVFMPFLPGDSLLFAAGLFAEPSRGGLNPFLLVAVLSTAAILGDSTNYWIGRLLGPRMFRSEQGFLLKKSHLETTNQFYERYGGWTVILARFVPIVRTFAPFVAGLGSMRYRSFLMFSVIGSLLWVGSCVFAGYLFGGIPAVREHFSLAVIAIIAISVIPAIIKLLVARYRRKHA